MWTMVLRQAIKRLNRIDGPAEKYGGRCSAFPGGLPALIGLTLAVALAGVAVGLRANLLLLTCAARTDGPRDLGKRAAMEEPLRAELLAAIRGSRVAFEGKIETVAVEVNLLQADLWKVSDKVKVAEGSILELQTEVGALPKQMSQVTSKAGEMEVRLEDAEGRS
ncbi:hypothetical protein NDU88_009992 [Pleurodeles waltl]|uniref:Uncharacterized protein n=1 Tax=Pleurodeles waltl TaxID=8319 RepID=A0AAV7PWX8_PLEWA|nr:hypothetical protein NDU88_009992 [Pleurodeles waltl]